MKRRALLLDRDGVINVDHGYVGHRDQFEFVPGVFSFLRSAEDLGFRLAIATNQSGVARGFYTAEDFARLTTWMLGELAAQKINIDLVLACFEHRDGQVPPFVRQSFWRKPNPGMILEVTQRLRCEPARSAFLGDTVSDMKAGQAAGIGQCLLFTAKTSSEPLQGVTTVRSFDAALAALTRALNPEAQKA